MGETAPILSGIVLGAMLDVCKGRLPRWAVAAIVSLLAASATIASGEFRASWGYILVDVSLVVAGAAFSRLTFRCFRRLKRSRG